MESLEMEAETEYMENFEKLEEKYDKFYNKEVTNVKLFFIYINEFNEIYSIKSDREELENGSITKERILYLIKKNKHNLLNKHKLVSLLQYNIDLHHTDLNNFIISETNKNYLTSLKILDSIQFSDTIPLLADLNSIIFIYSFISPNNQQNNTTKRILLTDRTKTKTKTRRK
jgi:hypothetical protein